MLNINKDPLKKAKASKIIEFTPGIHIQNAIYQEELDIFKHKNVKALIMDSFAELTDQLFISKLDKTTFCTGYTSVIHNEKFERMYKSEGRLDIEKLECLYREFFKKIREVYQDIPIIFINFPAKLDTREEFKNRERAIVEAISEVEGTEFINPKNIKPHETDPAVYHFSQETYRDLAIELVKVLNKYGINAKLKIKS